MTWRNPPSFAGTEDVLDYQPEDLPLDEVIRMAIKGAMLGMRVCLPCKVTAVHGNQLVDLQPLLKGRFTQGNVVRDMPIITQCMALMPHGQNYSLKLPIAVGDMGLALFCDRSLDVFLASQGQSVDPQDSRAHDLNDAIFVPGLYPSQLQTQDATSDLVLTNGSAQLRLEAKGAFALSNGNVELFALLDRLIQNQQSLAAAVSTLVSIPSSTVPGTYIPNTVSQTYIAGLANVASGIASQLETLKG